MDSLENPFHQEAASVLITLIILLLLWSSVLPLLLARGVHGGAGRQSSGVTRRLQVIKQFVPGGEFKMADHTAQVHLLLLRERDEKRKERQRDEEKVEKHQVLRSH